MKKNFLFNSISIILLFGLIVLALSPLWPMRFWWIITVFQIGPLWIVYVPLILLLLISLLRKNKFLISVNCAAIVVLTFGVIGFQLNVPSSVSDHKLRVLSVNLGEQTDVNQLTKLVASLGKDLDIIAFQEASGPQQAYLRPYFKSKKWNVSFQENQGVATRFSIVKANLKNRRFLEDWGAIAGKYVIRTDGYLINFINVHLESPREGIEALLHKKMAGIEDMRVVTKRQQVEASAVTQWAAQEENVILAGDFNMLDNHPAYQFYFKAFSNAFAKAGIGFGFTKYTSWHGVRIDHVLTKRNFKPSQAKVLPSIGGDHRPLFVTLDYLGEVKKLPKRESIKEAQLIAEKKTVKNYIIENFEQDLGRFKVGEGFKVRLDYSNAPEGSTALVARMLPTNEQAAIGFVWEAWSLVQAPDVSFHYRLSEGMPAQIRVLTEHGDWLCIGGTNKEECPYSTGTKYVNLNNDGQWHFATFNIREAVQSVLKAIRGIKAFQFFVPQNRLLGDEVSIDQFIVQGKMKK